MASGGDQDGGGRRARARDVVGLAWLPPGRVVALTTGLRAAVAALHLRMAPPPLRILESVLGAVDHAALVALCDLGVPDALRGPTTLVDLAVGVGADEAALATLVRYAATRRWLRMDRRGRVRPTATTRFLAADHPGGWRAWVELSARPEVRGALAALGHAAHTGGEAFAEANGESFFAYATAVREFGDRFDDAMAAGGRLHGLALAAAIDWSDIRRVCDVGGGNGALLRTLLGTVPHLAGVLFDLPPVVQGVASTARLEVVAGDAFAAVPAGCDAYLLVNVLHDWDDDRAAALLDRLAGAVRPGAVVIVVDAERRRRLVDGVAARSDVLMLALAPGGQERTAAGLAAVARRAGFEVVRTVPLASGDQASVLRLGRGRR